MTVTSSTTFSSTCGRCGQALGLFHSQASCDGAYIRQVHPPSLAATFPIIQGRCPACGSRSLFLGAGGYVTCSWIECSDPTAAADLLAGDPS